MSFSKSDAEDRLGKFAADITPDSEKEILLDFRNSENVRVLQDDLNYPMTIYVELCGDFIDMSATTPTPPIPSNT